VQLDPIHRSGPTAACGSQLARRVAWGAD
jgi:hypothetical protein